MIILYLYTPKLELFSKILLSLRPASARNPEGSGLRPKTEKFSLHFFDVARPNFFQKGKENFLFWIFAKAKRRKRSYGLYYFIRKSVLDPLHPFAHA
jgi:hypothetical protein